MKVRHYLWAAATAAALCMATAARAEVTTAGSIGAYSDYRLRGVSLSDKRPVMQGSIEFGAPLTEDISAFAGVWGSSLDKDAGFGALETDWYIGAKGKIGELGWTAKYLRLVYYDEKGLDFDQFAGELTYPIGPLSGAIGFVRDEYTPGHSTYLYTSASYAFADTPIAVKGTLGYEDGTLYDDKVNWGLGVTYTYKNVSAGLEYQETNRDAFFAPTGKNLGDGTVVFSLTSAF